MNQPQSFWRFVIRRLPFGIQQFPDSRWQLPLRIFRTLARAVVLFLSAGTDAAASPPFRADRLLIQPRAGHQPANLARLHAAHGVRVRRAFPAFGNLQVLELPVPGEVDSWLARYRQSGLVEFAEPDYALRLAVAPNDPRYTDRTLWHLNNIGQSGGLPDADIDAPEGWDTLHSATNVTIAIVDTGVRYTHEDLAGNLWINPDEIPGNGTDDDQNGFIDDVHGINAAANTGDPWDIQGHGTQVAGVAGAVGNNGRGVAGVAWRVNLMACRFYDDAGNGYLSDAVQCFDYARANGAHVINASFVSTEFLLALQTAINNCRTAGIIVVAAAGNDANDNDSVACYPANYPLDNLVSVAATTRADLLADYSNYGATTVDLAAPGSSLYTTGAASDSAYLFNNGTSFAAPLVSGTLALMRRRYPTETYLQLINRVLAATDPLPSLTGKCVTGGRLNLARALGPSLLADFTVAPPSGAAPLAVTFADTSFGAISSRTWQFGDGDTSAETNPAHLYLSEGNYTATLTVTGTNGWSATTNHLVAVIGNYQITNAPYAWVGPDGMTNLNLSNEGVSPALPLPFVFQFYGRTYQHVYVGANGLFGFESQGLATAVNADLPNTNLPNAVICPFWDDLSPGASGDVFFGITGAAPQRQAVVSWVNVRYGGMPPATYYTFQAMLEEASQEIRFQYQSVTPGRAGDAGRSATIGLESDAGTVAAKYSFNGSTLLADATALRFIPPASRGMAVTPETSFAAAGNVGGPFAPASQAFVITNTSNGVLVWRVSKTQDWLSVSAAEGTLVTGQSTNVWVSFNEAAAWLSLGSYSDTLAFSNVGNGQGNTARAVHLAVVLPPTLAIAPSESGGPITLNLDGEPQSDYVLETSLDFRDWMPLSTNQTDLSGMLLISNLYPESMPQLFYRARRWMP